LVVNPFFYMCSNAQSNTDCKQFKNKSVGMIKLHIFLFVVTLTFLGCGERRSELVNTKPEFQVKKLKKVTFYLENSESMFGYVNGLTEYVQVISELSSKSDFISNGVQREFILINGKSPLSINSLGDVSSKLNSVLTPAGYRKGNTSSSELNEMLKLAMQNTGDGNISVFISDGIFDINNKEQFSKFLTLESGVTKGNFLNKLSKSSSFQTLLIKLNSHFDGKYFFASQNSVKKIKQTRPYYIWVFGDSHLVNKYFNEEFITKSLIGQKDYLRFIKLETSDVKYGITRAINRKGNFDVDNRNPNSIKNAEKDPSGSFSFSFAVDFNSLPFSEAYLTNLENYTLSENYKISYIQRIKPAQKAFLPVIDNFNSSHIVTLVCKPQKSHVGVVDLQLKYVLPSWINSSLTQENVSSPLTIGFDKLTSGIAAAYKVQNQNKNLADFKFQIKR
jgi:hypothetical protein